MERRGTVDESTSNTTNMATCSGVPRTDSKKKRSGGRPPGSKNKTKTPAIDIMSTTPSSGQVFAPWAHVVQVSAGDDVARAVAASACRLGGYISVISASGPVFPPVFRQPFPYSPVELISIGHFFLISILPDGSGGMSAILAGPHRGMVLKGAFTGPLVAAGTVVVVVSAAPKPNFCGFAPNNSTTCAAPLAIRGGDGVAGKNGRVSHQKKLQHREEQQPQFMSSDGAEEQHWRLMRQENQECTEILSNYLMEDDHQEECELVSRDGEEYDCEWNEFLINSTDI